MFKRIGLFLATNLAVMVLLTFILSLVQPILVRYGIPVDIAAWSIIAVVIGMGGSFISLAMSKWIAKTTTRAQVITQPRNQHEAWLLETVRRQARQAGIGTPEVAIYDAPEPNAFATGMNRNNALVAVSTGLLRHMKQDEVEAVLGHEVSHVANGDMITLALIQGVLNTLVIFLARIIGSVVDSALRGNREGGGWHGPGFWISVIIAEIVLGLLATIIVMWFSRRREFRADIGGANLAGRQKMIAALERLKMGSGHSTLPDQMEAFGIIGRRSKLFMSHPPLDERIAALKASI